jgi:hypothetical protein
LKAKTEAFVGSQPVELIWSYWHEEGMLVRTMDAISTRFQGRAVASKDPLARIDIDPLRPLSNLLWGYVQNEPQRLTARRRAYEYDHHYGLALSGGGAPRSADFPQAFHALLGEASRTTADPSRVGNALAEVRRALKKGGGGAHNQYGDLPWTARVEMLMQQWLLARPEVRAFLPRRRAAGDEPWMARVDAMRKLQAWPGPPARHYHDLAVSGEQLLLSIRSGEEDDGSRALAASWAGRRRPEVQRYIHAYKAVTGVNLTDARGR